MKGQAAALRYVIASHSWLPGVRLSKPGHWGNIPYPDAETAQAAAAVDAGKSPFTVERLTLKR